VSVPPTTVVGTLTAPTVDQPTSGDLSGPQLPTE
jgi:hypothetical protein